MADEYIKREDALDAWYDKEKFTDIESIPSADVQPVRRGKWIEKPAYEEDKEMGFDIQIVCSECDAQNSRLIFNEYHEPIEKMFISSRFCPNCGADMRSNAQVMPSKDGGT